jgi:Cohesin domain/Secretion system C-terminal sorting domain/HYR domain/Dockerin type I domain
MKSEKFTLTKHIRFGRFIKMSMLSVLLTVWYSGLQAQCPLACNNLVQVSMDENCIVEITPDMMLEGQGTGSACNYTVVVLGTNGQPLAAPTGINPSTGLAYVGNQWITCANIGQTLTVRVRLGANSCWGTIKIEDKLPPVVSCFPNVTVGCYEDLSTYLTKSTSNRVIAATGLPTTSSTVHSIAVTIPNDHQYSEVLSSMSVLVNGGTTGFTVTLSKSGLQPPNPRSTTLSGNSYRAIFNDNILRNNYQGTWTVNITSGFAIAINSLSITYSTLNFLKHPFYIKENCNVTSCADTIVLEIVEDVTKDSSCVASEPRAVRTIKYRYKDKYGNLSSICTHRILLSPINILRDISCPKNYDGTPGGFKHLSCDGRFTDPDREFEFWDKPLIITNGTRIDTLIKVNKYPDPHETGYPVVVDNLGAVVGSLGPNSLCKVNISYSDAKIDICPQSFKILRQWVILDWCTGVIASCNQIIKVIDDKGPTFNLVPRVTSPFCPIEDAGAVLSTNPYTCTATYTVDAPIYVFDCDGNTNLQYTVKFKKSPNSNDPVNCNFDPYPELPFLSDDGLTKVLGTPGVTTGPNAYRIEGLPIGRTWVRYFVSDRCGNINTMTTEIDVVDKTPPVAVCDEYTVVTLGNNGFARVFANTFDDGSHDNCTPVGFQVSRMVAGCGNRDDVSTVYPINPAIQTMPGKYVQFCCDDITKNPEVDGNRDGRIDNLDRGYIQVILTVWDDANQDGKFGPPFLDQNYTDNSNTCMVLIKVEDKVPPAIVGPPNKVINCGADTSLLASEIPVFSKTPLTTPYYTDNCAATITWSTTGKLDNCGQGSFTRTFIVTDSGGRTATWVQTITVRNNTPFTGSTIVWPGSPITIKGCTDADTDPAKTGTVRPGAGACSQVAFTYEDQVFPFVEDVCYKILRTWTVIDWCKFSPNTDPSGALYPSVPTPNINMWKSTQVIKVDDGDAPTMLICSKSPTEIFGDNCTGFVELKNSASDCTPANQLKWSYVIDLNNDGIGSNITGSTNDASATFPIGTHKITWTVEDKCGNDATCTYTFIVVDRKKPTPYCISQLTTVVMPVQGEIEIWARDFDRGSFDNCPGTLRFSSVNRYPTVRTDSVWRFTCSDFPSGKDTIHRQLRMYVWDEARNFDFCTVTIIIQKNTACGGSSPTAGRIAGNISTEGNDMIKNVQVILQNLNSLESISLKTDIDGSYEFGNVPENVGYKIAPTKNDDHLNGVSTLDLVLMQRHILDIEKFNTPYKFLAADINKDKKITAGDLIELRKLILGIYADFPNNSSWRFLDKAASIPEMSAPWDVNDYISIANFNTSTLANHFMGVKIGDINSSVVVNANGPATDVRSKALTLVAPDMDYISGQTVKMDITSENFTNIAGAQWTLNFDAASLAFSNVESGSLKLTKDNLNAIKAKDGKISFSWNDFNGLTIPETEVLFSIEFIATANNKISNTVKLSSDITKTEAYTKDLSEINMNLTIKSGRANENIFALDQNNPNPFTSNTTISFILPEAGKAKLTIYDMTGKVLKTITNEYQKGNNEVIISAEELNAQGVMFYELESKGLKATKKMIYLSK